MIEMNEIIVSQTYAASNLLQLLQECVYWNMLHIMYVSRYT